MQSLSGRPRSGPGLDLFRTPRPLPASSSLSIRHLYLGLSNFQPATRGRKPSSHRHPGDACKEIQLKQNFPPRVWVQVCSRSTFHSSAVTHRTAFTSHECTVPPSLKNVSPHGSCEFMSIQYAERRRGKERGITHILYVSRIIPKFVFWVWIFSPLNSPLDLLNKYQCLCLLCPFPSRQHLGGAAIKT